MTEEKYSKQIGKYFQEIDNKIALAHIFHFHT